MTSKSTFLCLTMAVSLLLTVPARSQQKADVTRAVFGQTPQNRDVAIFTLTNTRGMRARVTEYGAILVSLEVPDRQGELADIVLGFDDLESYMKPHPLFGAVVGRYANRIAGARFQLDGQEYKITANSGENHIHGGREKRFDKVLWKGRMYRDGNEVGVKLTHFSPDGEEGFPGNLHCTVTYTLTNENELRIRYEATTDKPTVINLTNHSYFNLAGAGDGDVLDHELTINAPWYTPAGEGLIPTGEIRTVDGTPLDFREPQRLGARIEELTETRGYDHNFVLKGAYGSTVLAARVREPISGRVMEVHTTEPGMQLYTANGMRGITGKGGAVYSNHYGVCFETQHFPDSPNNAHFPSTALRPDRQFESTTTFRFSIE